MRAADRALDSGVTFRYQAVLEVLDNIPVTEVAERFGVTRHQVAVEPGITVTAPRKASCDIKRHKASARQA